MSLDYETLIAQLSQVVWTVPRLSGFFLSMPVLGSQVLPSRIRLVLLVSFALIAAPSISTKLSLLHFEPGHIVIVLFELLLGLLIGFVFQLVFQTFVVGGQIIAMQTGLSFATMVDPTSKSNVPLISQWYMMMITLIFLSMNGHLRVIESVVGSFQTMPVGRLFDLLSSLHAVLMFSGWMFQTAVLVVLPVILTLLVVNIAFGVMARSAPQLNIFTLGFPITLLLGFILIELTLGRMSEAMTDAIRDGFQLMMRIIS